MTPPPAAGHAGTLPRHHAPVRPRRTSGPGAAGGRDSGRRATQATAARSARPASLTTGGVTLGRGALRPVPGSGAPLARRVAAGARSVPDARWLDRLIHGRGWIALVGGLLIGLVFLQVSLLQLNTGIGRAVQTAATLEQQNTQLRAEVSRLDAGERVQDAAARLGLVAPAAGRVVYLDARHADGARAARSIAPPSPVAQQPVAGAAAGGAGVVTPSGTTAGAADAASTPGATATAGAAAPATAAAPTAGQPQAAPPAGHSHPGPAAEPQASPQSAPQPQAGAQAAAAPSTSAGGAAGPGQ